jgi:hypothetical protein
VSRSEAIGRDPRALLGTLRTDVPAQVDQALETLGQWRGELIQHANSGQSLYVDTAMKVVMLPVGSRLVLETGRDMTQQRQASRRECQEARLNRCQMAPSATSPETGAPPHANCVVDGSQSPAVERAERPRPSERRLRSTVTKMRRLLCAHPGIQELQDSLLRALFQVSPVRRKITVLLIDSAPSTHGLI